jgi:hypothetical protein
MIVLDNKLNHLNVTNMSQLKFSDGMEFDLSGPLRVDLRSDGYYVLGQGMMMAVDTFDEGQEYILRNKNLRANIKSEINK